MCFNPRAPRGARPARRQKSAEQLIVSIHAPLAGRDGLPCARGRQRKAFQSTRPSRGATSARRLRGHLLRGFNPRAPRGARRLGLPLVLESLRFQSTRPSRGATGDMARRISLPARFNPRAPRGARRDSRSGRRYWRAFQSTRPSRGATPTI